MALKHSIDALVVGAGPVGLAAALTLVRAGHREIEIIDEAERRTGLSYALALHPATLEALAGLGVAVELTSRANRIDRVAIYDGAVRRAELELASLERGHPYVLVVPQSVLEEVLLAALAREGVEVRWRHRLSRLAHESGAEVACAIDRIDAESSGYAVAKTGGVVGKTFEREIPLVLGADGHGSLVRRALGLECAPTGPSGTVAVFELEGERLPADLPEEGARRELRLTIAGGARSVWWPLPGGRSRLGFDLASEAGPTAPRDKSRLPSIVPWLASALDERRLHELVAERMPWHATPSGRLMWSVAVRFERALASAFGRGRVWLAGDAAHLAFPFGVRSMNEGIVEAVDLATRFGRILDGAGSLDTLEAFGRERLAHWQSAVAPGGPGVLARETADGDSWLAAHAAVIAEALPVAAAEAEELLARAVSRGES